MTAFWNVISKREILQKFDRHVFESIIDRVIVGEKAENGEINPYKLKFIFKTGYEKDEVASSQPFSFVNSCSNGNNDCDIIFLQGDNDTGRWLQFGRSERKTQVEVIKAEESPILRKGYANGNIVVCQGNNHEYLPLLGLLYEIKIEDCRFVWYDCYGKN